MKEIIIYEFQAKQIKDTLRLVANRLDSSKKLTSLDRDVMQSMQMIENAIKGEPEKHVSRI